MSRADFPREESAWQLRAARGIFDQWLCHGSDLVHLWTDESYPVSAAATGAILTWKDGRENPDNATVTLLYPKGFIYTYSTTFSNSYSGFTGTPQRKRLSTTPSEWRVRRHFGFVARAIAYAETPARLLTTLICACFCQLATRIRR